jgi:hypothetical protein
MKCNVIIANESVLLDRRGYNGWGSTCAIYKGAI